MLKMEEELHTLVVTKIPKHITPCKLRTLLGHHVSSDLWNVQLLIPLEEWNMAYIECENADTCESFLQTDFTIQLKVYKPTHNLNYPLMPQPSVADMPSVLNLTHDCLRHIFEKCTLKEQIALTKVCQQFHELVVDIWRCNYKTLLYNLYDFEFKMHLSTEELQDFCIMVGTHVRKLIFNSIFYFPLIQKRLQNVRGNLMWNAKIFINVDLCKHIMHFEHLHTFEVQGKFLADFAVKELARYCKDLRVFTLVDADTRWLRGKNFALLRNLEALGIKDCENFQRRHLIRICSATRLKHLNIVECKLLQNARYLKKLSRYLTTLETLQLTALANVDMLRAILNLPNLKMVQFYWLNDFEIFEKMLYAELQPELECTHALSRLKFINDCVFFSNESQERLTDYNCALMREKVTLKGRAWNWHEKCAEFSAALASFTQLEEIICEYCRPFTHDYVLQLPRKCASLRSIKFIGCREREDELLLMKWQQAQDTTSCQLSIAGLIPVPVLDDLREKELRMTYRTGSYPIFRSVECHFK